MKKILPIVLGSLAAALAAASGDFLDRVETFQRTASGMAARSGLVEAGGLEKLRVFAWERGGWIAADLTSALKTAGPVFFLLILAAVLVSRLPDRFQRSAGWTWAAAVVAVCCWGVWNGWKTSIDLIREPRLIAPVELLKKADELEGRIFFTPSALFLAPLFAPEKIEPGWTLDRSMRLQTSLTDWRAEDRKNPFTGIVIVGGDVRPSPFLEMVRSMPGWNLAATDNHGLLFVRKTTAMELASPEAAKQKFASPENQAIYLSQAAMVQQAIEKPEKARDMIGEAMELSDSNQVRVRAAQFAASEGRWSDVLETLSPVLKKNRWSIQARYLEALAFFETGAISKAAEKSNALAESCPQDSAILSLQARVAAQNNDPATEILALEKLLALAKRGGQPSGDFHALLGQAWARHGFPDQALANYQAALGANPAEEVRAKIEESMKVIRERTR